MKAFRNAMKSEHHLLFWTTYGLLAVLVALVTAVGGVLLGYVIDLPQVEQLQEVRPNIVSYVYARDGRVLGQFALEKRILVSYEQIPEVLKQSILAAEDEDFFEHPGIDFQRLFVTALRDIFLGERKGASTLTMQLSKILFTGTEKTLERKVKDMLFAIEIEKQYTKEQIFTFYCNQIYMGHGTYGIASAADYYFHKPLDDLTLAESALLAGIIQVPERHSPINYPDRSLSRRNSILRRMQDEGLIDEEVARETQKEPLGVRGKNYRSPAPYLVEWVRRQLEKTYSTEQIWEGGLRIYTTIDYDMQQSARRALRAGLQQFDKQQVRWTGPPENIGKQGGAFDEFFHPEWRQIFYEGQTVHGLVLESTQKQARVKIGSYTAIVEPQDVEWTGVKRLDRALKPGDLAIFSIEAIDPLEKIIDVTLDRVPELQGALMAIDNQSGAVRAMVGGFDFQYSKFNRATQAIRQPGSLFKPFTYVAALEAGYSPNEKVLDAPVSFRDGLGRVYAPENSDREFRGLIPIRQAFALSRNVPTIRLANAIGVDRVIEVAHRFGIQREFLPYLPIALGAGELTLQEIVSAFTTFPNNGLRAEPHFIQRVEDYHGTTLEEHQNHFEQAISSEVAQRMVYLLRSVIENGTGRRALVLNRPLGGKTGTTNDSTDSWFVGFSPQITAGVWAGYDEKKSLGERVYGSTLALPIWIDFMQEVFQDSPAEEFQTGQPSPSTLAAQTVKKESTDNGQGEEPIGPKDMTELERRSDWSVEDIPAPGQPN